MVVIAASIVTKSGRPVLSRQFRQMPRSRIEVLLASFPKLIPANSQHTTIETADVRYVYQPLEDLYILLITNKASNILMDIDTLHLVSRVVTDIARSPDEREILRNSYEILGAFDEVISLGYREQVNLVQVRNVLEMESHEEKIQEIISRNKEAEAKEELKRRAKALENQRREQIRRAQGGGGSYPGSYSSVPRFDSPGPESKPSYPSTPISASPSVPKGPAFKAGGMKLGKKAKQSEMLEALGTDTGVKEEEPEPSPQQEQDEPADVPTVDLPEVEREEVHVSIQEQLSLSLLQAGGLKQLELTGALNLLISSQSASKVKLTLEDIDSDVFDSDSVQFKYHPKLARTSASGNSTLEKEVSLKDPSKGWPVGSPLGVLRWRVKSKDESLVPLTLNCWPTPSGTGSCDVNIDYELENDSMELYNLIISIPLPEGNYPEVTSHTGEWLVDPPTHSLLWVVPHVSPSEDTRNGTMEFTIAGEDASAFFPVKVNFTGIGSLVGIKVASAVLEDGESTPCSQEATVTADDYVVA